MELRTSSKPLYIRLLQVKASMLRKLVTTKNIITKDQARGPQTVYSCPVYGSLHPGLEIEKNPGDGNPIPGDNGG